MGRDREGDRALSMFSSSASRLSRFIILCLVSAVACLHFELMLNLSLCCACTTSYYKKIPFDREDY